MKKKFTYLFSVVMAFAFLGTVQAKEITIYVQADQQPNLHFWGIPNETSEWPGVKLTETTTVNNLEGTPVTFYYKTFTNLEEESGISFLFNYNGDSDKTRDINGVMEDRYYIYKGNHEYEDITSLMTGKADDVIEKVQLPGDFSGWNGDANTFELGEGRYNYVRVVDFSEVTADFVTFKLLVNNGHWLGWNDLIINAPDGWTQEAAADGNIQLNLKAIGAKQFTFIATWAGGHMASAGWKLSINADADAIINKVQLPGTFNEWNGDYAELTKAEGNAYTYLLDLSEVSEPTVAFKLLVNDHHWLGYYDLVDVVAPDGWAEESIDGGNIQLNLTAADTKKFKITATWAGGTVASAGWSLKITDENATDISTMIGRNDKGLSTLGNPVYDLSGRKVTNNNLPRGLYIKNGKKFIK